MSEAIVAFQGEHRYLSNFYSVRLQYEGCSYPSVEHAFQAAKSGDIKVRRAIAAAPSAALAKQMGRALVLRSGWEQPIGGRVDVMRELLWLKFGGWIDLGERLLATDEAPLVEGTYWHDLYWGTCSCLMHKGSGENMLGKLLVETRDRLRREGFATSAIRKRTFPTPR